jgi:psiF repeat-containing protein
MKAIMLALVISVAGVTAASAQSCTVQAGEKKLAGAAKNSFMKKCSTDAEGSCNKQAAEKKLSGAAKTSFTKKCVTDAVGA